MDARIIGITAALGSAASWAVGAILMKKVGDSVSSLAMTLAKGIISSVLLAVAVAAVGYERVAMEPLILLAASGLLGIAVSDTCFFEALKDLGPLPLVLLMMLGQVLTVVFAVVFLGERPAAAAWAGIVLVMAGIGVVLWPNLSGEKKRMGMRGLAFGLASIVSMSVSTIIAKRGMETVTDIEATLIRMVAGTAGVLVLGLVTRRIGAWMNPFKDMRLAGSFLLAVLVVTFGGFWLSMRAVKYADVATANTLISTESLFVIPLAAIFLKERITLRAISGASVAVIGIGLLIWAERL